MSIKAALSKVQRIPEVQTHYNVFNYVNEMASSQLKSIEKRNASSKPLAYTVAAVKDNIVTKDMPSTCSSKILDGYMSPFDATVVSLLLEAGTVIAGKANMDEFGMGSAGIHSYFGPTFNPLFKPEDQIVTGGSSSGSAAAVAAGVVDFALGTDTGGSVRLPASYTSTFGFKPSYGRLSRHGVISYAQSLDTVGIFANDLATMNKVFSILDKYDEKDPTSLSEELRHNFRSLATKKKSLKIGIPEEFSQESVPAEFRATMTRIIKHLMNYGHEVYPVSIPSVKNALSIYYTLSPSEAVSNLSRYDGLRYGYRAESDIENGTLFTPTRSAFGPEVQNRIILGNYNLCSESFKNNYIKAQKLRVQLINDFDSAFRFPNVLSGNTVNKDGVDIMLSLTSTSFPGNYDEVVNKENDNPLNTYINDIFTMPMSLCGLPTMTVPAGNAFGIQAFSQHGNDYELLDACYEINALVNS
ncbi:unnamed protein product [Kluyveromyces dobzhanskii CBS 2104]|uniref:Glutamyl-tRNA(Gln) amidotransferase subunit A, mitochondrial n=1 Tax=Kluyveromyces dobzhanskii CBS 2104 TaxID=1427455 RepID=A0A0A8KZ12_9SACH|nr:unnamed protein product [Kluyveromyces dobzhanskii CBS 2104]